MNVPYGPAALSPKYATSLSSQASGDDRVEILRPGEFARNQKRDGDGECSGSDIPLGESSGFYIFRVPEDSTMFGCACRKTEKRRNENDALKASRVRVIIRVLGRHSYWRVR